MDAFELLKADHKKVAELFDRLESARGKTKLDVFKQIKAELDLHAHIEETIFYPALEKPEETHDLTLEAYEEHRVVKTLLAELSGARSANDEWQAKAKVLRENVEHHVDEEENELFDKADDALSKEQIEALGEQMEAEKARKQGGPVRKQPVAKGAGSSRARASQPGILSKLASYVGLGDEAANKNAAKNKRAAKKAPANKKTGTKKSSKATTRSVKATTRGASKKTGRKSSRATASKRSASAQGSKRTSKSRPSGSRKSRGGRK
jgi:hemerythrin-like domain-containing protein